MAAPATPTVAEPVVSPTPTMTAPAASTAVAPAVSVTSQPHVTWTALAASGTLVLAQSDHEFAVYNDKSNFGRWPRSDEGYRFAYETYNAHAQSRAHGVAYAATGYRDPVAMGLPTDPVIKSKSYASPLSFVGSTRRLGAWASKASTRNPSIKVVVWVGAVLAMIVAWWVVLMWYFIIFVLFGIFVIPYRLIRRSSRKSPPPPCPADDTGHAAGHVPADDHAPLGSGSTPPLPPG